MKMNRDEIVAGTVAGAAFIASAQHIWNVAHEAGNHAVVAALHPVALDGLIYIGLRAMMKGHKRSGLFTIAVGAGYSLAFNGASYGGFQMPVWALAACLPASLILAAIMVHGKRDEPTPAPVERVVRVDVPRPLLPIVPLVHMTPVPAPPVRVPSTSTRALSNRPTSGGPAVQWDMDKVVRMIQEGTSVQDIRDAADVSAKVVQRTTRVVRAIASGAEDASIVSPGNITLKFVQSVRAIMETA